MITDMRRDLKAESCWWLFRVTTCRGRGHIVAAPLHDAQLVYFNTILNVANFRLCSSREIFELHIVLVILFSVGVQMKSFIYLGFLCLQNLYISCLFEKALKLI